MTAQEFVYECMVILRKTSEEERKLLDFEALYYRIEKDFIRKHAFHLFTAKHNISDAESEKDLSSDESNDLAARYAEFCDQEVAKQNNRFVKMAKDFIDAVEEKRKQAREEQWRRQNP